jgi:hypothetical protein
LNLWPCQLAGRRSCRWVSYPRWRWAPGHAVAPGLEMRHAFLGRLKSHQAARKFDGTEGGDVGDGEALAGNEGVIGEFAVEPAGHFAHLFSLRAAEVGKLGLFERRQSRVGVPDPVGDASEKVQFDPPVRHLDEGAFFKVAAHQVGQRRQALEIGTDGARFTEHASVVQFENRDLGHWVAGEKGLVAVLTLAKVDDLALDAGQSLLGNEHQYPAWVGRPW